KGSGVARGAPLRPTVGSIAHLARGASRRGREHRVGHRMDGGGDGPAQPLRRGGAVAPAPGLRVCGGGRRRLGGARPGGRVASVSGSAHWSSWPQVQAAVSGGHGDTQLVGSTPGGHPSSPASGVTIAAAGLAGIVATLGLMLAMVVVSFAAFFLLGLPALLGLVVGAVLWGVQAGFGGAGPLQPWLAGAGGAALLALALNTGAALPI